MAIEKITSTQSDIASQNLAECQDTLQQKAQQIAEEQMKKAKEQLDKANQLLSEIPEVAIGNLTKAIDKLLALINGHDINLDPQAIIAQIESLLKPVISALTSLPIPEIPGLKQISSLLSALMSLISMSNADGKAKLPSSEIPPELMSTLQNLLNSLLSLCQTLPLVLINLIFQILNVIIGLFKQIASILGVPSIPYPLSLVPNCISMMPDLMAFMLQVPGKIYDVAYDTLKKAYGTIVNFQVPSAPDNVEIPKTIAPCPLRDGEASN